MIFETIERDVVTSGAISSREIELSANAKAYRIIFGQIYPDIIKAIVRELFANAWDSQKVANKLDTPIDIHLPTALEPYFSIRDYGVGMTPQIIDDIYSRVFESSKDTSNEEAGMFGMGSKTPLGYTDSFAIVSYVDGQYWAYSMYITTDGKSRIDLVAQGETTEPNGVVVTVGVRAEDFDTFKAYAETFAVNSGSAVNINRKRVVNTRDVIMEGEDWSLLNCETVSHGMMVQMGCILYKLDYNLLSSAWGSALDYKTSRRINTLVHLPMILNFPIGTFEVTGSREDIIYNQESAQKIISKIQDVDAEAIKIMQNDISNADTLTDALDMKKHGLRCSMITSNHYKWKSWKLDRVAEYIKLARIPLRLNPYATSRRKTISDPNVKIMRRITEQPTDEIEVSTWFDKRKITYVVIDDGNTNKVWNRLHNLDQTLIRSGLGRWSNSSQSGISSFNILYIDGKNNRNLSRLPAILPSNYIVVKLADIEPMKIVRNSSSDNTKKDRDQARTLMRKSDGKLSLSQTVETIDPEYQNYYIRLNSGARNITDEQRDDFERDMEVLGIEPSSVFVIGKMNEYLIDQFDLLDLYEEADSTRDSFTYSDTEILKYVAGGRLALNHSLNQFAYGISNSMESGQAVAEKLGLKFEADKWGRESTIVPNVNETVKKRVAEIEDLLTNWLEKVVERNPIFLYIGSYQFRWNLVKILKIQGEM